MSGSLSNAVPSPPGGPRRERRARRALSDASVLAVLLFDSPEERAARLPGLRAALRREGLAALLRRPATTWPQAIVPDGRVRSRLAAAVEIGRRALGPGAPVLTRPEDVYEWCADMRCADRERFVGLYLDARHRVMRRHTVSVGTLTASLVHPREVFAPAIRARAAALVVVHNHPSGDPEPSPEDCALTERLREGAKLLGVDLLDHVVVARGGFVSFRERGAL
ncbi:MAG TPA: DNA repair protein RadC [Candidatus Eisenbacteria bacterium]|nr:DNA repair protein RadC [Candidatus Eisenbacteria bacterium]